MNSTVVSTLFILVYFIGNFKVHAVNWAEFKQWGRKGGYCGTITMPVVISIQLNIILMISKHVEFSSCVCTVVCIVGDMILYHAYIVRL